MLDVKDTITLTYPSKPASPATVTVTIGLPDGTTAGPFSAPSGSYDYPTVQVGRHTVLWVATGPSDAYSDVFDVAGTTASLVSLADVRAHLNESARTTDDDELRLFIEAATGVVEHIVGPVTQTIVTEVVAADDTIVLAKAPVLSVASIVETFPCPGAPPFTVPQYLLDGPSGLLRRQPWQGSGYPLGSFYNVPGLRLTVTYTTGRPSIPAAIRLAALIIIRHLWETQRMAAAGPLQQDAADEQQVGDMKIPSRAYELLEPYRRAPVIA